MVFTNKSLDKIFTECSQIIPMAISFLSIEKKNDDYSILYVDEENADITYHIKTKFAQPYADKNVTISVYDFLLFKLKPLLDKKNLIEGEEYIYQLPKAKSKYLYLRRGAFVQMRNKDLSNIGSLAFKLNINKNIIYAIENNEVKNYGIDSLLKYCFYFKKQPLFFLSNSYRKAMVENLVSELLTNKLIAPEQAGDIEKHFLK